MLGCVNAASKAYQTYDASHLRAAGIGNGQRLTSSTAAPHNETAASSLRWDAQRPETPTELKKYRLSALHTPGVVYKHFGAADDPVNRDRTYGRPSHQDSSTAACFKTYPDSDLMRYTLERAESVYHSTRREPLGRGWVRGHELPEGAGTQHAFGRRAAGAGAAGARELIAPGDVPYDDSDEPGTAAHERYVRSHGAFGPGEQRRRPYDWAAAGVDPASFRFGATDRAEVTDGVRKALDPSRDAKAAPPPAFVPKVVEDHKLVSADILGQSRKIGAGDRGLPEGFTFGRPSLPKGREDGVEKLLPGCYSAAEQEPDADLGRSLREGYRNWDTPGHTFGVPSVRTDLAAPRQVSLANAQNFGNEPSAFSLLAPCSTADRGVNETQYVQRHGRAAIAALLEKAGISGSGDEFEACFAASAQAESGGDTASLKTFMDVRHAMLHKRAGL